MIAVNNSAVKREFEEYCDRATEDKEIIVVRRKNEKNVVLISFDMYDQMKSEFKW